ncbi:HAD-IA family hydrolase [Motiliproteus sediminis]|uniref:HAD-IA family hydrolase n=1 Tax=Motiliproteus sediminis TaxID=1468178 RepID=UPI001AEFE977|nr:HAD-IA family hydrolase [Motiliproteus sediminis]
MTTPRRAVLFDLDGTLIDTAPDFHACINRLRQQESLPPLDFDTVRSEVSNGGSAMIQLAFGLAKTDPGFQPLLQRLLDLYSHHIADHSRLFDRMEALLCWLEQRHWPWGIVTNKPERFARPLLRALNLDRRCSALICPEQVRHTKPDPEGLLLACARLRCQPAASVYVGDHPRDIEAGKNAGMMTATALFGYLPQNSDPGRWGADYAATSATALQAWLASIDPSQPLTGTEHV